MIERMIAIIDIDGILTDYPNCFLVWVSEKGYGKYKSLEEMQDSMTIEEYNSIKHQYRISGVKAVLPVNECSLKILEMLNDFGYSIWIITMRPIFCREDTLSFLNINCIPFNRLVFTANKRIFIKKIMSEGYNVRIIFGDNMQRLVI